MAKICYVNAVTGNNANNGLSAGAAKKNFAGAKASTAAATASTSSSPDIVLVAPGVYYEDEDVVWSAATDVNVVYISDGTGEVIVDFENRHGVGVSGNTAYAINWRFTTAVIFVGITFRNFPRGTIGAASGSYGLMQFNGTNRPKCINCVFYQRDGAASSGRALFNVLAENCSFYNLERGIDVNHSMLTSVTNSEYYGNYFKTVTTPFTGPVSGTVTRDYNALPGNTETNGLNTSSANTDPGFRGVSTDDFRINPTADTVAWDKFLTLGRFGGRISAAGRGGPYYDYRYPQLRMITPAPTSAIVPWENDPTYTSGGTLGTVIQDGTTGELKIDLATTPTATDARARSDVYNLGSSSPNLATTSVFRFESPTLGAVIDTNTTYPRKWEYRSSGTSFAKGDGSPSWIEVEAGTYINVSDQYLQFRVTFRTDHTNA